jgi:hypothetical protein
MSKERKVLEAEKQRNEQEIQRLQHQNQRLLNREQYLKRGERNQRTHRLCARAGFIEHCAPDLKELTEPEFYELFERILAQDDVKKAIGRAVNDHRFLVRKGGD